MYNLKGFITIDSMVSRQAKAISPPNLWKSRN